VTELLESPASDQPALTQAESAEFARNLARCEAVATARAAKDTWEQAAKAAGENVRWAFYWHDRYQAYLASHDPRVLLKGRSPGRPPLVNLDDYPEARDVLRALAVSSNRGRDAGSIAMAIWKFVHQANCPEALRAGLVRPGRGPSEVADCIRRSLRLSPLVHRFHRNPTDATGVICARLNRTVRDATGVDRPLQPGELLVPDDATVNFYFTIPDTSGNTECSRRWGCRVGRYELLAMTDVASLFIPSFQFVFRERDSYTADDVAAFLLTHMRDKGVPDYFMLEGGAWQAERVQGTIVTDEEGRSLARIGGLRACGVELLRAHDANDKTWMEARWNKLWTILTEIPGQIGRTRGEMRANTLLMQRLAKGVEDPRKHLFDKQRAVRAVEAGIDLMNHTPVESRDGRWIPAEKWAASPRVQARREVPAECAYLLARERREWTVMGDTVQGRLRGATGSVSVCYRSRLLMHFHGHKVAVFADGYVPNAPATLVWAGAAPLQVGGRTVRPGDVIGEAVAEPGQPVINCAGTRTPEEESARAERLASKRAVGREYRSLRLDHGRNGNALGQSRGAAVSEIDDGAGGLSRMTRGIEMPAPSQAPEPLVRVTTEAGDSMDRTNAESVQSRCRGDALIEDFTLPVTRRHATAPVQQIEDW